MDNPKLDDLCIENTRRLATLDEKDRLEGFPPPAPGRADAGLEICGLALVLEQVMDGRLTLPFPVAHGAWTSHAFRARFRSDVLVRPQVRHFGRG